MKRPDTEILPLWSSHAPGSAHLADQETFIERQSDPIRADRDVEGVVHPALQVWWPENPCGAAVIIAPGGGYQRQAVDKEGADVALWFNSLGVAAFVLKYRLPDDGHENGHLVPLQDAQRALRLVRSQAEEWGLDAGKIGCIGFSAGAHLAGTLMSCWDYPACVAQDSLDTLNARPDFAILGYPVCGMWENASSILSTPRGRLLEEFKIDALVRPEMPPVFIFHADDDPVVPPAHAMRIYSALKAANQTAELHIYRSGGHGFGIRYAPGPRIRWTEMAAQWLGNLGVI